MPRNVIVVGSASRVDQEQAIDMGNRMLLSIVVSRVGSIVASPVPRFAEIETIFADRYVAMVIVVRIEIKPISKSGDRGLIEATVTGTVNSDPCSR